MLPILRTYLANYETTGDNNLQTISPLAALAEHSGVEKDTIYRITLGRYQTVEFDVADRLLCGMNMPFLWQQEPLRYYYWPEEGLPPDPSLPVKCENPRCEEWFHLRLRGGHKRHCSDTCRNIHNQIITGRQAAPGETFERACGSCGHKFEQLRARKPRKYCSGSCVKAGKATRMRERKMRIRQEVTA